MDTTGPHDEAHPSQAVLLISMPMADPLLPNLAIEQLAQVARRERRRADVFYGTLRLPPEVPLVWVHAPFGQAVFAPAYRGVEPEAVFEPLVQSLGLADKSAQDDVFLHLSEMEYAAQRCIEQCLAEIPENTYSTVGFSILFDAQKLASALLARRLKDREPHLRVLFGGTGCDGPMAQACLEAFSEVDFVYDGEGIAGFTGVLDWIERGEPPTETPPGLVTRDGALVSPAKLTETIATPDPDYSAFLAQKRASPYADAPLTLFFESARGCWWGRKQHCTFCGIRSVREAWRPVTSSEALRRILTLWAAHRPSLLYCVDPILDLPQLRETIPALAALRAENGTGPDLFYEVKSNLSREQVALLADAGVTRIQPGIENFSSDLLRRMRKGVTGLQQVALLKWCATYGIEMVYGYLIGIPDEQEREVLDAVKWMPLLHHLPPPISVNEMGLHRFSPYFEEREQRGLAGVRPFAVHKLIYGADDDLLDRLCYDLDYDPPWRSSAQHRSAHELLRGAVADWAEHHRAGAVLVSAGSDCQRVCIRDSGRGRPEVMTLNAEEAALYRELDAPTDLRIAAKRAALDASRAQYLAASLQERGLLLSEGNTHLALAVDADEAKRAKRRAAVREFCP